LRQIDPGRAQKVHRVVAAAGAQQSVEAPHGKLAFSLAKDVPRKT
jgi:hypothetical protein